MLQVQNVYVSQAGTFSSALFMNLSYPQQEILLLCWTSIVRRSAYAAAGLAPAVALW